jgi:hypothetical protein
MIWYIFTQICSKANNSFLVVHLNRRPILQGFIVIIQRFLNVIKGHCCVERVGVEVGTSKYPPRTCFGKFFTVHIIDL